ncbi:MAG: DUF2007 domain-containing protein [Melioribacteraceae bacterium]
MPKLITSPSIIESAGNKPKIIREYFGRVNSKTSDVSIAKMTSPQGWIEPGQKPEFDEYTIVLKGILQVETESETFEVKTGEAILTESGEWIRYSTPFEETEYMAVCLPAFSPRTVHRDGDEDNKEFNYVKILKTFSQVDIAMIKSLLDGNIDYYFQGENFLSLRPLLEPAILMVNENDAEEAKEVLKDFELNYLGVSLKEKDNEETEDK